MFNPVCLKGEATEIQTLTSCLIYSGVCMCACVREKEVKMQLHLHVRDRKVYDIVLYLLE